MVLSRFELRNLTSRTITLFVGAQEFTYEPDGPAPRVNFHREYLARLELSSEGPSYQVPINSTREATVVDLPDPEPGIFLVVPSMVARYLTDRGDLLSIDRTVRSDSGRIFGASGLASLGDPDAFDDFVEESLKAPA